MHEMSLCESVLQIVEEEAARQRFSKVKWLQLEIGTLAGVEP
ncbi:MAG TPA: hydrogenase maturation nickel metallochaperone HypA, partial [Gammaproteobacteria bacterium]|nr:hydrogenase maturation nickel metallochaperone HypA [Gammaproteobacteria bacterium]